MEASEFGICRLALVPVRKEPGNGAEQISQLLFGEHYEIRKYSADKKWIEIFIVPEQSEGWIDAGHHHSIGHDFFDEISHADFKITTDVTASLLYKKSALTILLGSIVPISTSELFKMEEQLAFNGESKSLSQKRDGEFARTIALKYVNAPFIAGGRSPFGIDSPGLIQMVCKISGYSVPRDHAKLATIGREVASIDGAQCGDLAFFESIDKKNQHCGMVVGDDKIIHAFGRVRIDHLNEEGILNPETHIYTHTLTGIRRVFAD